MLAFWDKYFLTIRGTLQSSLTLNKVIQHNLSESVRPHPRWPAIIIKKKKQKNISFQRAVFSVFKFCFCLPIIVTPRAQSRQRLGIAITSSSGFCYVLLQVTTVLWKVMLVAPRGRLHVSCMSFLTCFTVGMFCVVGQHTLTCFCAWRHRRPAGYRHLFYCYWEPDPTTGGTGRVERG